MELREIGPIEITDVAKLGPQLDSILEALFSDLDGDCQTAIQADREETKAFRRAREKMDSEQDVDPNARSYE